VTPPALAAGASAPLPSTIDDTALASPRAAARWRTALAAVCGLVLLAATVEIVLDAAQRHSPLKIGRASCRERV
jgi:hypothetical protein